MRDGKEFGMKLSRYVLMYSSGICVKGLKKIVVRIGSLHS
jgi:hypothetical protein